MKVHFINCGIMQPRLAKLLAPQLARIPCLCLLIEADDQLVLVDTGFGTRDIEDPRRTGHVDLVLKTIQDPEYTAVSQIERLGFRPEDVNHILCTHLDRDHAGGLPDFPHAQVHVLRAEQEAALNPRNFAEKERYRRPHFAHGPKWVLHEDISSDKWFGMDCIRGLPGLPPEILFVPLPGHTRGHSGVAAETEDGWLLHCGDACYLKAELEENERIPFVVRLFIRTAYTDYKKASLQQEHLKKLMQENQGEISMIASHDSFEYERLFGEKLP
jgi:glyoxylase-like metal-dependent hydrolase (beta-lactamase superfamily II)